MNIWRFGQLKHFMHPTINDVTRLSQLESSLRFFRDGIAMDVCLNTTRNILRSRQYGTCWARINTIALISNVVPKPSRARAVHTSPSAHSHGNPLGLPRSKPTPPNLQARMTRNLPQKQPIRNVRKIVAVSSAKGGVGKSTIAANLALALARRGLNTGILDTDIFGPSIPTLFGLRDAEPPALTEERRMLPLSSWGVKTMSMGYLIGGGDKRQDAPVAWRGLMVTKALQQLLYDVEWGPTDVLVLDLPPGTGDIQLSLAQQLVIDGAVLVTTPQVLAVTDTMRGLSFFGKTDVRVLGVVRNMSAFLCPCCGEKTDIFGGHGQLQHEVSQAGTSIIADVPLRRGVCEDADAGRPTIVARPDSGESKVYTDLAARVAHDVGL